MDGAPGFCGFPTLSTEIAATDDGVGHGGFERVSARIVHCLHICTIKIICFCALFGVLMGSRLGIACRDGPERLFARVLVHSGGRKTAPDEGVL